MSYLPYNDHVSVPLNFYTHTLLFNLGTILLILDHNIDLVPLLSHSWTYQALISNCLKIKLNCIMVALPQKKAYDLDAKDFFG